MSNLSNQSAVDLLSSLLSLIQNVNESVLRSSKEVAQRLDKLEEEITQQEEMIRGLIDRFNTNPTTAIGGNTTAQGRWANIRPTYKHPRGGENERYRQFSWGLIDTIGQHVEGSNWDRSITQSFQRNSRSISNLIASNGRKHGNLPSNSTWIDVISVAQTEMARLLEDMSVDLFPLRACEGQWGARLIMTEAFRRTSTDTTPKKQAIAESSVSSLGASRLTISQPSTIQEAESSRSGQQRIACTSEHPLPSPPRNIYAADDSSSDSESAHENEPVQTTAEKVYRDDFEVRYC
ncbi:hypothetical protein O0I10_012884 [Lichtheimia ornata]|uniref:Uncharacterized protein n=1 Tax=Lichtheimia ornata TaxID=688661 RepID=A0AAD7XVE2_9FUNG|nr:uncharacterized protein O0I10_012884 [Lichtheimia ornata]KAJ8651547.1 hypothetical protein O0I10_012884 [Lichtheimia ornata]